VFYFYDFFRVNLESERCTISDCWYLYTGNKIGWINMDSYNSVLNFEIESTFSSGGLNKNVDIKFSTHDAFLE
jgi:hypothetical protein